MQKIRVNGVLISTAQNRLKKLVLFDMAKQCDRLNCFRCHKPIESPKDLSVDHKIRWRDDPENLFYNLNNIAFSHLDCNTNARQQKINTHCKNGHLHIKEDAETKHINGKRHKNKCCLICKRERWQKKKIKEFSRKKTKRLFERGYSLREIARKVGVSHITIRNIIIANPQWRKANALDC